MYDSRFMTYGPKSKTLLHDWSNLANLACRSSRTEYHLINRFHVSDLQFGLCDLFREEKPKQKQ